MGFTHNQTFSSITSLCICRCKVLRPILPGKGTWQSLLPGSVAAGKGGKAQAVSESHLAHEVWKVYTSPPINCFSCSVLCILECSGEEWLILACWHSHS